MKKTIHISVFFLSVLLMSCKDDMSMNPDLVGRWQTPGAVYTFKTNQQYAIEYVNDGESFAPVADSVFGDFTHNSDKSSIVFYQKGYRIDSSQVIVRKDLNGDVWKYTISGDELTYDSKTQTGLLKKISN